MDSLSITGSIWKITRQKTELQVADEKGWSLSHIDSYFGTCSIRSIVGLFKLTFTFILLQKRAMSHGKQMT